MKVERPVTDDMELQRDIDEALEKLNIKLPVRPRSAMSFFIEENNACPNAKSVWDKLDGEDRMMYLAMEASDRERYQREVNLLTDRLMASKSAYELFCEKERENVIREIPGVSDKSVANILSQRWFSSGYANQIMYECLAEQEGALHEQRTASLRNRLLNQC